ncbi:replication initiator protein A [Labrenzia sp. PHM005]|uniref:replication initiator protein A n=1 Tax=Labrenzia sp. PHM005 TaxID=2590016 RepID=UPI0011409092|nr:replication initiator protein A [Labrenzia sp. PHM005]QDG74396.1 replication initiator protein A [Labrenzia sp. PHM005]
MTNQTEQQRDLSPLLPDRHPEPDFFVCDIFDAAPKADTASMVHPLFTLSTKPDYRIREYSKGAIWLKVKPGSDGAATVHDRDVLIYCISQCMAAINDGRKIDRKMRFRAHDLLRTTNRKTSGEGYRLLQAALARLQSTQIETNIVTGGAEQWKVFSFIDSAETIKETRDGRMQEVEITLSDWVFNAIREKGGDILTISRDYFRLRKPLERRLYEIARKSCGQKSYFHYKVQTLYEITGSASTLPEFRRMLTKIIRDNQQHRHIPDYVFELDGDLVKIRPKREFSEAYEPAPKAIDKVKLKLGVHEAAKKLAAGWDTYSLEDDWRAMLAQKGEVPANPEGSFVGFVKWYVQKHGAAR